ncbi:hypothetical protein BCR34DRAFT_554370 [Clohesyomyces aquaticus]|uniref:Uncharacterized protein n=1 Tax=Clohesyomyces aquaticus TaxID=1231657 RepID=A0A1Y2A6U9_9PLEO|nr:hypothetical protein BCR34DRAFT_554370 [Clohesyomyces aquaticus]
MCCIGRVCRIVGPDAHGDGEVDGDTGEDLDVESKAVRVPAAKMEIRVSCGLGHGCWGDDVVTERVNQYWRDKSSEKGKEKEKGSTADESESGKKKREDKVEWRADGAGWEAQMRGRHREIEWHGRGSPIRGSLILASEKGPIAVYKPRCAAWVMEAEGEKCSVDDEGVGVGVLGICGDEADEEVVRHILLAAVGIEEQIMASKGFEPRMYHSGW